MDRSNSIQAPVPRGSFLLACEAWLLFVLLDVGFRGLGFDRVVQLVSARCKRVALRQPDPDDRLFVLKVYLSTLAATRFYYRLRKDCLPRALTNYYLLRVRGFDAVFCVGVKKYPFGGHAWVEWRGKVLDDAPRRISKYTPLVRI